MNSWLGLSKYKMHKYDSTERRFFLISTSRSGDTAFILLDVS